MKTRTEVLDGVEFIVPDEPWFFFPFQTMMEYHDVCGAGQSGSFGERIIPEYIMGVKVSIACWIHDLWQSNCPKTLAEFRESNSGMLTNMLAINKVRGGGFFERMARAALMYCWYLAISTKAGLQNFIK